MDVSIYAPRISVHIWSYDGQEYGDDMVLHEDIVAINTQKRIDSPAGRWSLVLTSRRDSYGRTWAKRIRPQDYIEIYGSRTALPGAKQSIIMRGFVDNVMEDVVVGENGQVQRGVQIEGRDFGKILTDRQMVYSSQINPLALRLPKAYYLGRQLGIGDSDFRMTPTDFLGRFKEILVNDPALGASQPNNRVPKLQAYTDIPNAPNEVNFVNFTPATGSIWRILDGYRGAPWNEAFIRDDDNFPRLYWRLAPLHNKAGIVQHVGSKTDVTVTISLADIISEHTATSSNEAYCAFMAVPQYTLRNITEAMFISTTSDTRDITSLETALDPFNARGGGIKFNSENPILRTDIFNHFGFRLMKQGYPLFPAVSSIAEQKVLAATLALWMHNVYSWNPIQEAGVMSLKGNPDIRIGQHIMIREQSREFYVEGVDHKFTINPPGFTTNLTVTRGHWLKNNPYPEASWI